MKNFTYSFSLLTSTQLAKLIISTCSGIILYPSYPPINWWITTFISLSFIGLVLSEINTNSKWGFIYGLTFGISFYIPLISWINNFTGKLPWFVLSLSQALFYGFFGLIATFFRRLYSWPLWFSLIWVTQEWFKSIIPFGGFPLGNICISQTSEPFIIFAKYGGTLLVSLIVTFTSFMFTLFYSEIIFLKFNKYQVDNSAISKITFSNLVIFILLFNIFLLENQLYLSNIVNVNEKIVSIASIQGNIPRLNLNFRNQNLAVFNNHIIETKLMTNDIISKTVSNPMFVIWPEDALGVDFLTNADKVSQITETVEYIGSPILMGVIVRTNNYNKSHAFIVNKVIIWDPIQGPYEFHDKNIIQPFGEYIPWRGFFKYFSSIIDQAGYFIRGKHNSIIDISGYPLGVSTCWEVMFNGIVESSVHSGAQIVTVPSNNSNFNKYMSKQQLAFSKLHAIEYSRYVVVSGTTGVSAIIAPNGHEIINTNFFKPAYLYGHIRFKSDFMPITTWDLTIQMIIIVLNIASVSMKTIISLTK